MGMLPASGPREASVGGGPASSDNDRSALLAIGVLFIDPCVSRTQAHIQRRIRFPTEYLLDEGVVAVPSGNPARSVEVVGAAEPNAGDPFDLVDERVDRHELARPEVDRRRDQLVTV